MTDTLAALRAGAAGLLDAGGRSALAELVRRAGVELVGEPETWTMGSREVTAHRVALALPADGFLALSGDAAKLDAVRDAFAQAMRSPTTELAELHVELLLPGVRRVWRHAYRDAPLREEGERPHPDAVLAGAAALLDAMGDTAAAAMLGRAHLHSVTLRGAEMPLTQCVVQLSAEDRARTWREPFLEGRIKRAVRDAVSRAGEQVTVELGTRA